MMDAKLAHTEVMRLKALDNWLDSPEKASLLRELVLALSAAENDAIGVVVINEWLYGEQKLPTAATLRSLVWSKNDAAEKPKEISGRAHCAACRDSGITESIHAANLNSVAAFCRCEAGLEREYDSCPEGKCRTKNAQLRPTDTIPACCCAPWRVNAARKVLAAKSVKGLTAAGKRSGEMRSALEILQGGDDYQGDF
jgi:hypothetical protein